MSISDSESSSVTSSMADELSSVAFKAPLSTPTDSPDPKRMLNGAEAEEATQERDVSEDKLADTVAGACPADATEPAGASVVHVDEM